MKISSAIIAIATAALAGCGGPRSNVGIPAPSAQQQAFEAARPANGGTFNGRYSGRAGGGDYCSHGVSEYLVFEGRGKASFLHQSRESGTIIASYGPPCEYSGSATLSERKGSTSTVTMSITGNSPSLLTYTVSSGTGRFAKATGHGVFTIKLGGLRRFSQRGSPLCCQTYSDQWSGKLNF